MVHCKYSYILISTTFIHYPGKIGLLSMQNRSIICTKFVHYPF